MFGNYGDDINNTRDELKDIFTRSVVIVKSFKF